MLLFNYIISQGGARYVSAVTNVSVQSHSCQCSHVQSKKGCKDQESIQSSTTPDPGYQWESDKLTVDTTNESQEVSPFPAGDIQIT